MVSCYNFLNFETCRRFRIFWNINICFEDWQKDYFILIWSVFEMQIDKVFFLILISITCSSEQTPNFKTENSYFFSKMSFSFSKRWKLSFWYEKNKKLMFFCLLTYVDYKTKIHFEQIKTNRFKISCLIWWTVFKKYFSQNEGRKKISAFFYLLYWYVDPDIISWSTSFYK